MVPAAHRQGVGFGGWLQSPLCCHIPRAFSPSSVGIFKGPVGIFVIAVQEVAFRFILRFDLQEAYQDALF